MGMKIVNIPDISKEYFSAMLTVSLVLVVTGVVGLTSIMIDRLTASVLIGFGIILLVWTLAEWKLERRRKRIAESSIKKPYYTD